MKIERQKRIKNANQSMQWKMFKVTLLFKKIRPIDSNILVIKNVSFFYLFINNTGLLSVIFKFALLITKIFESITKGH